MAFTVTSTSYVTSPNTNAPSLPAMSNLMVAIFGQYPKDNQTPPRELRQVSNPFNATAQWNAITWTGLQPIPSLMTNPTLYISTNNGRSWYPVRQLLPAEYVPAPSAPIVILANTGLSAPLRGKRFFGQNSFFNKTNAPVWIVIFTVLILGILWFIESRRSHGHLL